MTSSQLLYQTSEGSSIARSGGASAAPPIWAPLFLIKGSARRRRPCDADPRRHGAPAVTGARGFQGGSEVRESMFPVRSSILSPRALVERVLPGYALPEPRSCRLISRSMNDIYEVAAGAETYFLRVSGQGWRSRDAVAAELALIADLYARGVAVAPAMPRDDGRRWRAGPTPFPRRRPRRPGRAASRG